MFVCLCVCLPLFTSVFVYLCLCLPLSLFTSVFVYLCLCLPLSLFIVHGRQKNLIYQNWLKKFMQVEVDGNAWRASLVGMAFLVSEILLHFCLLPFLQNVKR